MAVIPPSFIDEVRSKTSIVNIVRQSVKLKRKGNDYWGCCPFHHEKTASFTVNDEKEFYHCFGCGEHGDVFLFVQKTMGYTFTEAVTYLAEKAGLTVPEPTRFETDKEKKKTGLMEALEQACLFFEQQIDSPNGREALFYLQRRGVTQELMKKFRLGYAPRGHLLLDFLKNQGFKPDVLKEAGLINVSKRDGSLYDYFQNRLMFPIANKQGKIIAFGGRVLDDSEPKYLNSPDSPVFSKGDNLYALHLSGAEARKKQEIIVVEGYMDVIGLSSVGINRAVAPLGTALTERQIELLWRYVPEPLCCFDGDSAGIRAANRAIGRALPLLKAGNSLRFLTLPNNLDPDEYVKEKGAASFEKIIETNAQPLSKQLWQNLLSEHPIDTPERKAKFEKDIAETLSKITDASVKNFYQQEFKNALWNATSSYQRTPYKKGAYQKNNKKELVVNHPQIQPENSQTRMLLAYLLIYPEITSDFIEELSLCNPSSHKEKVSLQILIDVLSTQADISQTMLKEYLISQDKGYIYNLLNSEIEMLKRKKVLPTEIKQEFLCLLSSFRKKMLKNEIQKLANQITTASEDDAPILWEKLQNLKAEEKKLEISTSTS